MLLRPRVSTVLEPEEYTTHVVNPEEGLVNLGASVGVRASLKM